jgi:drug/metabolite transporter (DMT)-like permease
MRTGALFALAAALAFGLTTPLVQRLGRGAGTFAVAVLLYVGSALGAFALGALARANETDAADAKTKSASRVTRKHAGRVVAIAFFGAFVAPACLVWGLAHTSGTSASLLLNLEAVFTFVLGAFLFHEHVGRRVGFALATMIAGGALLAFAKPADDAAHGAASAAVGLGAFAVVAATAAWAIDNALTRPLSELDPIAVVTWKSIVGACMGLVAALAFRDAFPALGPALGLVACGAVGYGVSLRLYLLAQRRIGAGRTASVFAVAPFCGAALAFAMGEGGATLTTLGAAALFGIGVWLHVTEKHDHLHHHNAVEHDHPHRHDDGHHDHTHDPPVEGEHTHAHKHEALSHAHAHGQDVDHQHRHD